MSSETSVNITDVVNLVGGRLMHLRWASDILSSNNSYTESKDLLLSIVRDELYRLNVELPPSAESNVPSITIDVSAPSLQSIYRL